ncbi:hypothetical protein B0A50_04552 [Salinomyces thailandicus]|uniref:Uncharacterized protein n=1 Tax=Salinomyces thailandicus TaxID=706561 RepID=A0A4U0TZJ8_9PEZI|nr:hypothetical protein B0A50_04552 [Salinomyces thailandica]
MAFPVLELEVLCDATHSSAATSDCPENSAGNQNATSSQSHQSPFTVLTGLIDRPIPGEHDESWMLDLDLLHHYLMHTNNILMGHYDTAQILRIWHEDMPKIALSSHYCMHALLGLTALHKAHVQPNIALMLRTRAVDHLDKALVLYREHGQQTTAKNANARFAFSWLVALFAYAVPPSVPPIDAMTELFLLVKGIDIVLGESWFSISQGPFAPVLAGGPQTPLITTAHKLPDGFDFGLDHLDYMLGSDIMLPDDRRTCVLILAELKQTYEFVLRQQGRCSVSSILCFPKQDSAPYSQLLKRRVPQALIILAHYCVLLDILDSRWWINGWSSNVVRDIMGSLDEQWQSWIEWPVRSVVWKSDREAHTIEPMGRL